MSVSKGPVTWVRLRLRCLLWLGDDDELAIQRPKLERHPQQKQHRENVERYHARVTSPVMRSVIDPVRGASTDDVVLNDFTNAGNVHVFAGDEPGHVIR